LQAKQDQAAQRREAKERELDKANSKLRRLAADMLPINTEIDDCHRKIEEWLASQRGQESAEAGPRSVEDIRNRAHNLLSTRGVSVQSYQKAIAAEEKLFQQKEARLQLPEGGIETVQANFREQEKKLRDINREFQTHNENYSNLLAAHKDHSKRLDTLRDYVQDTAELLYFKNLEGKNYVGKMEFDHEKKTLVTSVSEPYYIEHVRALRVTRCRCRST
jgi:chromosome segregation ATPase